MKTEENQRKPKENKRGGVPPPVFSVGFLWFSSGFACFSLVFLSFALEPKQNQATTNEIHTCQRIRAAFDGGRQQDIASIGWVLEASTCSDDSVPWRRIATAGVPYGDRTVPEAELAAACEVVMAIAAFLSGAIEIDSTSGLVAGPALTRFPCWRQPQFDR